MTRETTEERRERYADKAAIDKIIIQHARDWVEAMWPLGAKFENRWHDMDKDEVIASLQTYLRGEQ